MPPPNDRGYQGTLPTHYRTGENEPLLGEGGVLAPKPPSESFFLATRGHKRNLLIFILAIMVGYMYSQYSQNWEGSIYDPTERERIRDKWEHEIIEHREDLSKLRQEQEREIIEHRKDLDKLLQEQEGEIHRHHEIMHKLQQEREEMQRQWHSDHIKLVELRRDIEFEHKRIEEERRELMEERRRWEKERQRRESEERERQRRFIQWSPLQRDEEACIRYGTARYQASLEYVPLSWDPYEACRETPIRVHQKDVLPTECRHAVSFQG